MNRKHTEVASYPAYTVIALDPLPDYLGGCVQLKANDKLGYENKGSYEKHVISSVISYALDGDRCPITAAYEAHARGHDLHYIFPTGASITAHKRDPETLIQVTNGMKIKFEGRFFVIERARNNNLKLVPVQ